MEVVVFGKTFSSKNAACRHFGILSETVAYRMKNGMSFEDALMLTPKLHKSKNSIYTNKEGHHFYSVQEICSFYGLDYATYKSRKDYGWDIERIITEPLQHTYSHWKNGFSGKGIRYAKSNV